MRACGFWSRLGNEKTTQFPELVALLGVWGRGSRPGRARRRDRRARCQGTARRISAAAEPHSRRRCQVIDRQKPILRPDEQPTAFIAFDLLRDGDDDLRALPLTERRARLEALFAKHKPPSTALAAVSEQVAGDGRALYARAQNEGWEGLLVKRRAVAVSRRPPQSRNGAS